MWIWVVAGGSAVALMVFGARIAVLERDLVFWKHMAASWRKTAKTYYAQKTQQNWNDLETKFRVWERPQD